MGQAMRDLTIIRAASPVKIARDQIGDVILLGIGVASLAGYALAIALIAKTVGLL